MLLITQKSKKQFITLNKHTHTQSFFRLSLSLFSTLSSNYCPFPLRLFYYSSSESWSVPLECVPSHTFSLPALFSRFSWSHSVMILFLICFESLDVSETSLFTLTLVCLCLFDFIIIEKKMFWIEALKHCGVMTSEENTHLIIISQKEQREPEC